MTVFGSYPFSISLDQIKRLPQRAISPMIQSGILPCRAINYCISYQGKEKKPFYTINNARGISCGLHSQAMKFSDTGCNLS
jgi:hypothetical protein